jgi:hypothetical protein
MESSLPWIKSIPQTITDELPNTAKALGWQ